MANKEQPKEAITISDTSLFNNDMFPYYLRQTFSDITLIVDGQRIYAHKSELALTDVSPKAFREILKYIYSGGTHTRIKYLFRRNLVKQDKACVISGMNTLMLLNGNQNLNECAYHLISDENGITVDLGTPVFLNHIKMRFKDDENGCYRYYITGSLDKKMWVQIVDYRNYDCRSYQNLYFDQQAARFIRIVGTYSSTNKEFRLVNLEIYLKSDVSNVVNQIVRPNENVATLEKGALVIKGTDPSYLINGNITQELYTHHPIGNGNIVVQLAQPYMISSMRLLLGNINGRCSFRYFIETSVNKTDWEIAVDRRNQDCQSWQNLHFQERMVVYVRITGTQGMCWVYSYQHFDCAHFECRTANE